MNKGVETFDGQKLKDAREALAWTHQQLADKIGVAHSAISRWESGKHRPKRSFVKKLALALKIKQEQLFTEAS